MMEVDTSGVELDPEPWRRCRCVSNLFDPDPVLGRCPLPATQEDGLCDHCRAVQAGGCPFDHEVCCEGMATELLDDPSTPCEVPSPTAAAKIRGAR